MAVEEEEAFDGALTDEQLREALSKLSTAEDIRFTSAWSGCASFSWLQSNQFLLQRFSSRYPNSGSSSGRVAETKQHTPLEEVHQMKFF